MQVLHPVLNFGPGVYMAIVNTDFLAQAACVRHACAMRVPCVAWPLLLPTFALSLFFLFVRFLILTHFGETLEAENLFPSIFWHK